MMLILLSVLLACILILVGILLAWSPGKPAPFLDENGHQPAGSISEKTHININGMRQGMFITGKDTTNPVLLFIHGGPGMPEYFLAQDYPTGLEAHFTVCWWEQRGAGLSYNPDILPETMTVEQLISDMLEVTHYLRNRFGQEKIYLLAHSWGSFLGIQAAARAPELYHAYIGMGQVSNQLRSERLAYEYMLEQFKRTGDKRMVQKLEKTPLTQANRLPDAYRSVRDEAMHRLGIGTTHDMRSVITGIFLPVMLCRAYTLGEKTDIWRGKWSAANNRLWDQLLTTDLATVTPELDLPVYFCQGIFDYTCSYQEALKYFNQLKAPFKRFYTFDHSAHSPLFEEPEKMRRILLEDVLAQ